MTTGERVNLPFFALAEFSLNLPRAMRTREKTSRERIVLALAIRSFRNEVLK